MRRRFALQHVALAIAAYVPLLAASRGRLAADTRQAVYLDPGRFLHDALSMWDPSRDLGTVTHQNIVLVWPMGVFYRAADVVGLPLWFAQRLWLGSILFAAGAGVLFLARTLRWAPPTAAGPVVAAFAYGLSPYVLQYGTRTSVLLLPWAALPWLIGLAARALRSGGWRHPALVALLAASIAVNATALALALLGPAVYVLWAVFVTREVRWPDALRAVGRMAVLGVATGVWWVAALLVEGRYGMPLLSYTETIDQVASTSSATEVLRGLGYWVPYLESHGYREVVGASQYLDHLPVLILQFAVVLVAVAAAVLLRFRHRAFFVVLLVIGVVVGVGAYPTQHGSPLASLFHDLARSGGIGLALRSTTRAAPMAHLALAVLLGAAVDALAARWRQVAKVVAVAAVVVVAALSPSIGGRHLVDPLNARPDQLPEYWRQAIDAADAGAGRGRMLELPGTRFASYRWGTTYEPITAGLAKTPSAWREQIPYGGPGSADMLVALDNRIQEGRLAPAALAPVARLLGATELLVRNDLEYERYDTVAPDRVWQLVNRAGLGDLRPFGPVGVNRPDPPQPRSDIPQPGDPSAVYPALGLAEVPASEGLVQVRPVSSTVVLDGNADGIVDAAGAGVLDGRSPVLEAAATIARPRVLEQVVRSGARIVLTDTNRRRVRRWRNIKNTVGPTLPADVDPRDEDGKDGGEAPLDVFPGETTAWQTVAVPTGARVTGTQFGNPLFFESGVRPAAVLDGDPATGWRVSPDFGGVGDAVTIALDHPVRTDHVTLLASRTRTNVSEVAVRFDEGAPQRYVLDEASRRGSGQELRFPTRTFRSLRIELQGLEPASPGGAPDWFGIDEVGIDGVTAAQPVRLPTALVSSLGARSAGNPLSIVLTRLGGDVTNSAIFGEERVIDRIFTLPTPRRFSIRQQGSGEVRIDGRIVTSEVTLAAGEHHLATGPGVDQIVLDSTGAGSAEPAAPAARWKRGSATAVDVRAPSGGASWLFFGESHNDGWHLDGVGAPVLLNGFGNGWLLDASTSPHEVHLRWKPQQGMRLALIVSALGALLALALAWRGAPWPAVDDGRLPAVARPRRGRVDRRRLVTAALAGLGAAVVVQPLWGLAAVVAVLVGGEALTGVGAVVVLAAAFGSVVVDRAGHRTENAYTFFTSLHTAHRLAMLAIVLLAAHCVLRRLDEEGER